MFFDFLSFSIVFFQGALSQRIPVEIEANLLNKIRLGDYENIHVSPFNRMDENLGSMASDKMTAYTYLTVAAITLFSRTSIECGVLPDEAFDLSDALLYTLSRCNSVDEIHNIFQLSATMFAKQVAHLHITPIPIRWSGYVIISDVISFRRLL